MKLRAIRLHHVGRFWPDAQAVEGLSDGLNVFAAENESGKSTVFAAMRLALFTKCTSKAQDVKNLRSYNASDGPSVELDLDIDGKRYRITKRYLTRPEAKVQDLATNALIAVGEDAEDWLKGALGVDDATKGPFGLLWVGQGNPLAPLIEKDDKSNKTQFLTSLVESEIESAADGGATSNVLAEVSRELDKWATKVNREPAGPYSATIKKVVKLEAQVDEVQRQANETEDMRRRLEALTAELDDPDAVQKRNSLSEAVAAAEQARQRALQYQQQRDHLVTTATLAKQQFDAADLAHRTMDEAQGKARAALERREEAAGNLAAERHKKNDQQKRLDEQTAAVWSLDSGVQVARTSVDNARDAAAIRQAKRDLMRLQQDLSDVQKAIETRDASDKAIAALKIDAGTMETLETLVRQNQQAEAERKAAATEVVVNYDIDASGRFHADERALEDDERLSVDGRLEIRVDGVGTLSVIAGRGAKSADVVRKATDSAEALRCALAAVACSSMEVARQKLQQKTNLSAQRSTAEAVIGRSAPDGLEVLKKNVSELQAEASQSLSDGPDLMTAQAQLAKAEAAHHKARAAMEAAEKSVAETDKKIARLEEQHNSLEQTVAMADSALGPQEGWAEKLQDKAAVLARAKDKHVAADVAVKALAQSPHNADAAEAALKSARAALQSFDDRRDDARLEKSDILGQLRQIQKAGIAEQLDELEDLLSANRQKRDALARQFRALKLLEVTLKQAQQETRDRFLAPVLHELKPMLERVLPGSAVELDEKFSPTGLSRQGINEDFQMLSGGTQEQIAVLTRLAFAKLLAKRGRAVPVVLDDALVFSDDNRLEKMFAVLEDVAKDAQILFLTCRLSTFAKLKADVVQLVPHQRRAEAG